MRRWSLPPIEALEGPSEQSIPRAYLNQQNESIVLLQRGT